LFLTKDINTAVKRVEQQQKEVPEPFASFAHSGKKKGDERRREERA
jgi:hypothetical protein